MSNEESVSERYRYHVAELIGAIDANDEAAFRGAFERLRERMNVELNPELKRITASAQSAMRRFRDIARIDTLAAKEVPDARKRLAHVVKMTDEAAHRTLDLVEQSGPIVEQWTRGAAQLLEEWNVHGSREAAVASLWPERAQEFLTRAQSDTDRVRGYLSEMLLAQGYQDLTGQIIRGVIQLVAELEAVLAHLVALSTGDETRRMPALRWVHEGTTTTPDWSRGIGPHVPGTGDAQSVVGQDDIDALLASVASNGK